MRKTGSASMLLYWAGMLAILFATTPVVAQTVVEKRLAALQPCSSLKLSKKALGLPVALGIDQLVSVTVDRAAVTLVGDDVSLSLAGGISCRTAAQSAIKGDASIDLTAAAELNLAGCAVRSLAVTPTRFGGSFGEILKSAWEPLIKPKLEADARAMLADACTHFVVGK